MEIKYNFTSLVTICDFRRLFPLNCYIYHIKKKDSLGTMGVTVHICNPSCSEGRDTRITVQSQSRQI
jgi:hypothetical protein